MSKFFPSCLVVIIGLSCWTDFTRADDAGPVPAFPWLHEGTVLTYSRHAAVAPGKPFTWKQNDDGDWIDPRTGKSYDKITNYGTSAPIIGQVRVLCLDGNSVGLDSLSFGLEQNLGFADPVMQAPSAPEVADVMSNSFWKSPAILADEASDASKGKLVTRCTWPFGDQKVDAVRIQITNDTLYQMEFYDLTTGMQTGWAEYDGPTQTSQIMRRKMNDQ